MSDSPEKTKEKDGSGWGVRHIITICLFLSLTVNYVLRVNLGVAVVVMTDTNRTDGYPVFDWTPEQKGLLLSSFFTGYLLSNLAAGFFVTKYSNKNLLLASVTYNTCASLATPTLVTWGGFSVMFIVRVSMGLVQGFMMPVTQNLLSRWVPPSERSRCGAFALGGMHAGTIISFVSSGVLSESSGGWPLVFHFSGFISGIWCLIWYRFGSDGPNISTIISKEERTYINKHVGEVKNDEGQAIPWKKIFTNQSVIALGLVMTGQNFGYWILVTQIPSYFAHILHFDASKNGMMTALPYICLWGLSLPISFLSDYLVANKILSVSATRKFFNTLGQLGAALMLVMLAYTRDSTLATSLYAASVIMLSFTYVGFNINVLDIAPKYAGLVMGMCNGFATVAAVASPTFVGYVVNPLDNVEGWKIVFLVAAAIFLIVSMIFVIFGSAEVQDFNHPKESAPADDIKEIEKQPLKT